MFVGAVAEITPAGGSLVVEPRLFRASMSDPPPDPEVRTGDEPFDEAMSVWSGDEAFVQAFLGPEALEWIRSLDLRWGIEVRDRLVAVYGPKPDRPDVVTTLETLRDAIERLPADLRASRPPV
jgi:hypothetical protein